MPSIPVVYLGWLSRFGAGSVAVKKYACIIVLSGPEPQRTIFEKIVLARLHQVKGKVLLVRGKPGNTEPQQVPDHVEVQAHLASDAMQEAFLQSEFIVSRGGYSTLMDAFTLQQKCIVVPTPGQTEQQYLAANLSAQKAVMAFSQQNFQLDEALAKAQSFPFAIPHPAANGWLAPAMHASLQALFTNQPAPGK
jgi:uncharacterized protein (TIGR00661 family)